MSQRCFGLQEPSSGGDYNMTASDTSNAEERKRVETVLADGNYDASYLYDAAFVRGYQLVSPCRKAKRPMLLRAATPGTGRRREIFGGMANNPAGAGIYFWLATFFLRCGTRCGPAVIARKIAKENKGL